MKLPLKAALPLLIAFALSACGSTRGDLQPTDALPSPTQETTMNAHWVFETAGAIWGSPTLSAGILYIGSSGSKFVLGLEALTGTPTAIYTSPDFHWSTPLVIGDTLYIGGTSYSPDLTGGLYSLKIVDGSFSTLDQDRQVFYLTGTLEFSGNWYGVASSPITEDGLIYFGGLDGKVYAVNVLP